MKIQVNGESREVANDLSLEQLVIDLQLTPQRIAVELNREVVRRADWPSTKLRENDRVEIVHFVGGGANTLGAVSRCAVSLSFNSGVKSQHN